MFLHLALVFIVFVNVVIKVFLRLQYVTEDIQWHFTPMDVQVYRMYSILDKIVIQHFQINGS